MANPPVRDRLDRLLTAVAAVLALAAVAAVLTAGRLAVFDHVSWAQLVGENEATNAILGVSFGLLGALAVAARPRNALSWLFVGEGQANALAVLGARWAAYAENGRPDTPLAALAPWVAAHIWIPGFLIGATVLPLIYPTGHWQSRRWRRVGIGALTFSASATLLAITSTAPMADSYPGLSNPLAVFPWSDSGAPFLVVEAMIVVFACAGLVALAMRFRNGDAGLRVQVGWLFLALLFNIAVTALPSEWPGLLGAGLLVAALGLAVLRYGLFDIEALFDRTLVYGALTTGVVAVFALFAGFLGPRINDNALGAVLAALVVAIGIGPARERVQQAVDQMMYGQRLNPYEALASITRQLEDTPADRGVLAAVAAVVSETLRLPYIAITLTGHRQPAVSIGVPQARNVDLPLVHAGSQVGELRVGLRRGERRIAWRDSALLADVAGLVGAAAHEVSLTADLRRSRERLVVAREEERRRLRRELHDGVGPALAGLALGVAAANRAASRGDPLASTLLVRAEGDVAACLADVRRISHDLRPAALDELGLVGALTQRGDAVSDASGGAPVVRVEAAELPSLPAAVEVAAYRIATEALTNTVRHANASRCVVRIAADGILLVEVSDDGRGLPPRITPGLGLTSMSERAAELGGSCHVTSRPGTGTTVRAELPLTVTA